MSSPRFICTGCKVSCHKLGDTCVSWGGAVASEPAAEVMPDVDDARRGAAPGVAVGAAVPAASTYKSARRFARLSAMHEMPHDAFAPALPQVGSISEGHACSACACTMSGGCRRDVFIPSCMLLSTSQTSHLGARRYRTYALEAGLPGLLPAQILLSTTKEIRESTRNNAGKLSHTNFVQCICRSG